MRLSLQDLCLPYYTHWFIKHLIRTAMGHKDREREMCSVLLSTLHGDVFTPDQVSKVRNTPAGSALFDIRVSLGIAGTAGL